MEKLSKDMMMKAIILSEPNIFDPALIIGLLITKHIRKIHSSMLEVVTN